MTGYYIVEEPDDFFPDDFGNDDAPAPHPLFAYDDLFVLFEEDPDGFFADDFGNDDNQHAPHAPTALTVKLS